MESKPCRECAVLNERLVAQATNLQAALREVEAEKLARKKAESYLEALAYALAVVRRHADKIATDGIVLDT